MSCDGDLEIRSHSGPYRVRFGTDLAGAFRPAESGTLPWVLLDAAVAAQHGGLLRELGMADGQTLLLEATEANKSYDRIGPVIERLLDRGLRRDSVIVAVGGGIVQDVAAFVATVTMRGIRWRFMPTTLLAQCDSCIGAKSSVNLGRFKNQLGSFHPPSEVFVSGSFLASLPEEALRSGFGEIVKLHLLDGTSSWERIRTEIRWDDPELLNRLVRRSLLIKQRYIEEDEFDRGVRNLLNYGHTFGHAFESTSAFAIPHGVAVAMGMSAATLLSERMGLAPQGHHREVDGVLRSLYRPSAADLARIAVDSIVDAMRTDKKHTKGATYAILTEGPGRMSKVRVDLSREVRDTIADFQLMCAASATA